MRGLIFDHQPGQQLEVRRFKNVLLKIKQRAAAPGEQIARVAALKIAFDFGERLVEQFIVESYMLAGAGLAIKFPANFIERMMIAVTYA